jgi:hypothetical protein
MGDGPPTPPSSKQAEMMGRVEWVMMHGGRDITARKSIEWGDVQADKDGNCSIRYKFYATIWDRDVFIMNKVFTFDAKGNPIGMKDVDGPPKKKVTKAADTSTKQGMIELVEDFFRNNFRDITSRETIDWGEVTKTENGNSSIRYKYHATIWNKDTKIMNQVFTFDAKGQFVSVKDVDGFPKKEGEKPADTSTKQGMIELVEDFFRNNFRDITSRETIDWSDVTKAENGNSSIRYKFRATIWNKDTKTMNKVFTFDAKGKFVSVKDVGK